jgi:hypothetical protein
MKIEVLYVPNCPNHAVAIGRLREILSSENFQKHVKEVLVNDTATAQSLKFPGSPTIRVDGHDVEPQAAEPLFGLMCRLYSDGNGVPSLRCLRAAIEKARSSGGLTRSWKTTGASVGAVITSLLTLGCCLPLPFLGAAGIAGASVFLTGARPWLSGFSVLLLGLGFFQVYRGMHCRRPQSVTSIAMLSMATIVVVLLFLFPQVIASVLSDISRGGRR